LRSVSHQVRSATRRQAGGHADGASSAVFAAAAIDPLPAHQCLALLVLILLGTVLFVF
jgi:hypothetical protein